MDSSEIHFNSENWKMKGTVRWRKQLVWIGLSFGCFPGRPHGRSHRHAQRSPHSLLCFLGFFSPFSGYVLQGSYKTQSFSVSLANSEFFQGKDLKELVRTSWNVLKVNEVSLLAMSREIPVALFPQSGGGQGLSQQLYGKIFFFLFKKLF